MDNQNKNSIPALECVAFACLSYKSAPYDYLILPHIEELILRDDTQKNDLQLCENELSKLNLEDEDDLKDLDLQSLDSGNYLECSICLRLFSPTKKPYGYNECNHVMCIHCLLKWIFMPENSQKISCVVCRQKLAWVIVSDKIITEKFTDFDKLNQYSLPNASFNNAFKLYYFSGNVKNHLDSLLILSCRDLSKGSNSLICKKKYNFPFQNIRDLAYHMAFEHKEYICTLCIEKMKYYPKDIIIYNRGDFIIHMQNKSVVNGNVIEHVPCQLCPNTMYFYSKNELMNHCKQMHIECYICNSVYFNNNSVLTNHFLKEHAYCHDCSLGLSRVDLKKHLASVHNDDISVKYHISDKKDEVFGANNMSRFALDHLDNQLRKQFNSKRNEVCHDNFESYLINYPSIDGQSKLIEPVCFGNYQKSLKSNNYDLNFPILNESKHNQNKVSYAEISNQFSKRVGYAKRNSSFLNDPYDDFPKLSEKKDSFNTGLLERGFKKRTFEEFVAGIKSRHIISPWKSPEPKPGPSNEKLVSTDNILWKNLKPSKQSNEDLAKKSKKKFKKYDINNEFFSYTPYSDMDKRHHLLYQWIKELVDEHVPNSFDKMEELCEKFSSSNISVGEFYHKLEIVIGPALLENIIYHMIAFLPDIEKQHILYNYHAKNRADKESSMKIIKTCFYCQQLILPKDIALHNCYHMQMK